VHGVQESFMFAFASGLLSLVLRRCRGRSLSGLQGGQQGALSFGVQTTPGQPLDTLGGKAGVQSFGEACQNHMSYCIAYTPVTTNTPPGDNSDDVDVCRTQGTAPTGKTRLLRPLSTPSGAQSFLWMQGMALGTLNRNEVKPLQGGAPSRRQWR